MWLLYANMIKSEQHKILRAAYNILQGNKLNREIANPLKPIKKVKTSSIG